MRDDKPMRIYQNGTYYYSCPYREPGAICCKMDVPCGKGGWNPEVEEKRKAALRARKAEVIAAQVVADTQTGEIEEEGDMPMMFDSYGEQQ